jgi:hypothetical protein
MLFVHHQMDALRRRNGGLSAGFGQLQYFIGKYAGGIDDYFGLDGKRLPTEAVVCP